MATKRPVTNSSGSCTRNCAGWPPTTYKMNEATTRCSRPRWFTSSTSNCFCTNRLPSMTGSTFSPWRHASFGTLLWTTRGPRMPRSGVDERPRFRSTTCQGSPFQPMAGWLNWTGLCAASKPWTGARRKWWSYDSLADLPMLRSVRPWASRLLRSSAIGALREHGS